MLVNSAGRNLTFLQFPDVTVLGYLMSRCINTKFLYSWQNFAITILRNALLISPCPEGFEGRRGTETKLMQEWHKVSGSQLAGGLPLYPLTLCPWHLAFTATEQIPGLVPTGCAGSKISQSLDKYRYKCIWNKQVRWEGQRRAGQCKEHHGHTDQHEQLCRGFQISSPGKTLGWAEEYTHKSPFRGSIHAPGMDSEGTELPLKLMKAECKAFEE